MQAHLRRAGTRRLAPIHPRVAARERSLLLGADEDSFHGFQRDGRIEKLAARKLTEDH